jgi:hypothetical protein
MTSPKPYGLHVISGELTDNDIDRISSVIHRFLSYKGAAQLENFKQVYDLPDGGYFIVQEMGGIFKVIADKQALKQFKFEDDGLVKVFVPMFFSGVIERSVLREGENTTIKLTQECRNRLSKQIEEAVPEIVALKRFSIQQSYRFPEFVPTSESLVKRTQYFAHNPGWYSGSMAKLHQFVGGYGDQNFENLPDNKLERAQFSLPESLRLALWEKYKDVRLPGYTGLPPINGEFQYDYRYEKTHAVAFDAANRPWLIQVDRKVWAMPLPIIPITADPEFHSYVLEQLGDSELIKVIETFGALPSGESFPSSTIEFQRWVRAGVIIEVCDTGEYLNHIAMFPACGWSFHSRGLIAYNTGYTYDSRGIKECATFRLALNLAASAHHYGVGMVSVGDDELTENEQRRLSEYLSQLFSQVGTTGDLAKSLRYKIRNIPKSEILSRAGASSMSAEVEYWDNYVCDPIAAHTGKVIKLYTGKLFHPAPYFNQPQIKFPYYQLGYCVSFDFSATERNVSAECDTIMYIYFDNDVVKVVKYFYTNKGYYKEVETDYEEVMTVGSWFLNETTGLSHVSGHFYTTDIDDREEVAPTTKQTTIRGDDRGYDAVPFFSFDEFFWRPGTLWRNRYFTHLTKTKEIIDRTIDTAIVVPMLNRSTVLHAKRESGADQIESESLRLLYVQDPYTYRYWTYDPIFAWNGGLEKMEGKPFPVNGDPVWVEIQRYSPSPVNEFANNGPWITGLPVDYRWLIHPNRHEWLHSGGGSPPKVREYGETTRNPVPTTGNVKWSILDKVFTVIDKTPENMYFMSSPTQLGFTLSRTSSKVFLGDAEYANISESNTAGLWKYTGFTRLVNHSRSYHFIGVINE